MCEFGGWLFFALGLLRQRVAQIDGDFSQSLDQCAGVEACVVAGRTVGRGLRAGGALDPIFPVARLAALVRYGEYLRTTRILSINEAVREAIEMVDAQSVVCMWPAPLVFDEKIAHSLKFGQKSLRNGDAGALRVIDGCVTKFGFGTGMNPVTHEILARTRARASSPGTMATFPARTSS